MPKFWNDMVSYDKYNNIEFSSKGDTFYINHEAAGYSMTLTEAQNLKGSKFADVETLIFDEFIIEDGVHHYLPDEVMSFLGLCESLARTRDFRCFMLANSVTVVNPYFLEFDLHLPYNNDIITFKDGLILVQYMKNEEYRQMKKNTRFGKLVSRYKIRKICNR